MGQLLIVLFRVISSPLLGSLLSLRTLSQTFWRSLTKTHNNPLMTHTVCIRDLKHQRQVVSSDL